MDESIDLFLSYCKEDLEKVTPLFEYFDNQKGLKVWYDAHKIDGIKGGSIATVITNAVNNSSALAFFCSPNSVQSDGCHDELTQFRNKAESAKDIYVIELEAFEKEKLLGFLADRSPLKVTEDKNDLDWLVDKLLEDKHKIFPAVDARRTELVEKIGIATAERVSGEWTLIVFVDELGTCSKDRGGDWIDRRARYFGIVIGGIIGIESDVRIIKNVGDAIIVRCDEYGAAAMLIEHLVLLAKKNDLRVAIHCGNACEKISEENVGAVLKKICDTANQADERMLETIWPNVQIQLINDVFGPDINRAGRMVKIPRESGMTLISEHAYNEFSSVLNVFPSAAVPIISQNGVEDVSYEYPFWIRQLHNEEVDVSQLEVQQKNFQTLRLLSMYFDGETSIDWEDRRFGQARDELLELILNSNSRIRDAAGDPCSSFYIDYVFSIVGEWTSSLPFGERHVKHETLQKLTFTGVDMEERSMVPVFLVGGSVGAPDDDEKIRNYLDRKNVESGGGILWDSVPLSRYLSGSIILGGERVPSKRDVYAGVFFTIRQEDIEEATVASELFSKLNDLGSSYVPIGYGLLRGDLDGFMIFKIDSDMNDFISALVTVVTFTAKKRKKEKHKNVFDKVLPVTVQELKLEYFSEKSFSILKRTAIEYSRRASE